MRNLIALLLTCAPEELERIAARWCVDLPRGGTHGERAAMLAREMVRDASAHRFWDALAVPARTLLLRLVAEPEPRLSALGLARDDSALRALQDGGAVWAFEESRRADAQPGLRLPRVSDPALLLPPELGRLVGRLRADVERGDTSGEPLEEALARLGTGELENLAAYWGLSAEPGGLTRDELLDGLLGRLSGASTEPVVREAPAPARRLYRALIEAGGRTCTAQLGEALALDGPVLRDAAADLAERLLALEAYTPEGWLLYAPRGPLHVPPGERSPRPAPAPAAAPERHTAVPPWAAAWDLTNLLRSLELYDVPAAPGGLPEAFVGRFETALVTRPADPAANLGWLYDAAAALGIAGEREGRLAALPGARAAAEAPLERTARRLLDSWLDRGREEEERDAMRGAPGWRYDADTHRTARRTLLDHLARCDPGEWYGVTGLAEAVRASAPHLLRPQNRLVRDLGTAAAQSALESWPEWEGRWIRGAVCGPLAWLHVLELHTEAEAKPLCRLTPDGAWLSGRVGRPPTAAHGGPRLEVSEEGRIRVHAPDGQLLWALAGFARPARAAGRPGYLVDRRSVARARALGISAASILALLRRHAGNAVPHRLSERIGEWGKEPHRIRMRPALLVACETEAGAEELLASPIARGHAPRRIGPTDVLLHVASESADEELSTVMRRLARSGLFGADEPPPRL